MKVLYLLLLTLILCDSIEAQTKDRLPCIDKEFSIVAHLFKDTFGVYNITEAEINTTIDGVNNDFAPICVSFKVCEFQYHDNWEYSVHNADEEWGEMQNLYHVKNRINIFYVDTIKIPENACGYAGLGAIGNVSGSGIVIEIGCGIGTHSHELGHYFGLEHTFMDNGTTELADGSNCLTTADGICDTPADPFIKGSDMSLWLSGCKFISTIRDANGDFYDPIVGNIMSYYPCSCGFTDGQFHKMAETYYSSIGMW